MRPLIVHASMHVMRPLIVQMRPCTSCVHVRHASTYCTNASMYVMRPFIVQMRPCTSCAHLLYKCVHLLYMTRACLRCPPKVMSAKPKAKRLPQVSGVVYCIHKCIHTEVHTHTYAWLCLGLKRLLWEGIGIEVITVQV